MLYTIFNVGGNDYKARLTAKACVDLEKKLGTNPLNILGDFSTTNRIPDLSTMLVILHASLQAYNHGITLDKVYDIYDAFVEEGNTLMELFPIIIDIFKTSGFFKEETEEKNALMGTTL